MLLLVHARLTMLAAHQIVGLSVQLILNVLAIKLVSMKNAEIHALEHVVLMLSVLCLITLPSAVVWNNTQETHLLVVCQCLKVMVNTEILYFLFKTERLSTIYINLLFFRSRHRN